MRGTLRTTSDYTCSLLKAKRGWAIFIRCLIALQLSVAAGCNSKMDVKTAGGIKKAAEAGFKVLTVSRVVTTPGQILQITGTNFQPGLTLTGISGVSLAEVASGAADSVSNGTSAPSPVKVISPEQATVTLPKQIPFGKYTLTLTQGASTQNVNLFSDGGQTDYPVFTGDPSDICVGKKFYNYSGEIKEGTKNCSVGQLAECSRDGETGCVANAGYTAAETANLAAKVAMGTTAAGISGTLTLPAPCATDGGTNCTANNAYPAAQIANFSAADIRLGKTVAGVAGSLSGAPPACAGDGAMGCIATSSFAAAATTGLADKVLSGTTVAGIAGNVTLPSSFNVRSSNGAFGIGGTSINPTLADCATDGEIGCVAVGPTYAAVFKTGLASKVLSTTTVAGVAGNVTLPAADKVLTGTTFGVSGTGSSGTLTLPSAGNVLASNGAFGVGGTGSTPTLTLPTASNVRVSNGAFGVGGTSITPTLPDCSADGGTSCVAVPNYTAAATTGLASKIVSGNTVAGIAGSATAESHSNCAGDGLTGCVATTTYASALTIGLASKVLSTSTVAGIAGNVTLPSASNVYTGIQYGAGGTANTGTLTIPSAGNVRSGNGTFGVGGQSITPTLADCSTDGGIGCVAVGPTYAAAFTTGLAPKIVSGNTVAGVAGSATAESHSNCAADGLTGCVATATYASALTTGLASKVLSTSTVAGVAGNVTLPAVSNVLTGTTFGVSGTGSTGTLTLPSASNVLASNGAFGVGGTGSTPTLTLPTASNVRVSNGAFGAGGASITPTLADCAADGGTSCVAVPSYTAAATTGLASKIVSGNTVAGIAGSATAESHSNCAADGLTGCVATATYASALTTGLASKVLSTSTVAGIAGNVTLPSASNVYTGIQYGAGGTANTGTLTIPSAGNVRSGNGAFGVGGTSVLPTLADCSADGGIGCVAVGPTYAAAFTTGLAPKIVSGNTVAGIAGSATAESHSNCAADGLTGCVTVAGFKSADMSVVTAGNIKSGVTVAGVLGAYPSATYTLPSASATADLTSLAGTTPAGSYEWWGPDGARYSGSITDAGMITATTANQTFNTSVYRQFTVAGSANLTAGNIKSGVSLFGVTGAYPSATYLLSGADNTADLDLATFDAKIKSAANFEWFSPDGTRYTNSGNTNITAANIASGVTIFGTTGSMMGTGAVIDPWNVRMGATIGGVTGKLPVNCRNQGSSSVYAMGTPQTVTSINTTNSQLTVPSHGYTANQTVRVNYSTQPTGLLYNTTYYVIVVDANTIQLSTTSGPGAAVAVTSAGADVTVYAYNTGSLNTISSIDDYYNYTGSGYNYSNVWTANNTCAGVEATAGDSNVWKDVTTDASNIASTCATTPANCTYQDKISGLWWSKSPGTKDWTNALLYCSSLNYNNQTGWRLPAQKELMNAYEHGIMTASNANWMTSTQMRNYFWSSSTYSNPTIHAIMVYLANGYSYYNGKSSQGYFACVR